MSATARAVGTCVLLGFAAGVLLTPLHLLSEEHHLFEGDVTGHGHSHRHEDSSHDSDSHSAADHEIVARRAPHPAPAPLVVLAVPVDLPREGVAPSGQRIPVANALGPPDPGAAGPHSSRAPPLL